MNEIEIKDLDTADLPFFARFLEGQMADIPAQEAAEVSGGSILSDLLFKKDPLNRDNGIFSTTSRYPSDSDEFDRIGTTQKFPSDREDGSNMTTWKYPSDRDSSPFATQKFPSDGEDSTSA